MNPTDNAAPWLQLAAQAQAGGDDGADEALRRAGAAGVHDPHVGAVPGRVLGALPDDMTPLERAAATAAVADAHALGALPGAGDLDAACGAVAVADPERRAACDSVARMLATRSRSAAAALVGVQLGERLGWTAQQVATVTARQQAALAAASRYETAAPALGCAGLQRSRERAVRVARHGDEEAGRQLQRLAGGAPIR